MNCKKLFTALILSSLLAAFAFADSAEVIAVKGKVEVSRNNEWVTLKVGDKVSESETISTGFQSEAKIKYKESVMQLGALSRVTLSQMTTTETKDVVNVYLNTGAVRSKVNHTADKKVSYTVRNQVAVASVRGTDFISMDDGSVIVYTGAVVLTPAALYEYVPLEPVGSEEAEESPDPADGESNAATDKNDVDPNAPDGGVMVLGGQSSEITSDGKAAQTFTVAVKTATSAASTVSTAASSEAVSTSTTVVSTPSNESNNSASDKPNNNPGNDTPSTPDTPTAPTTGGVDVKPDWPAGGVSVDVEWGTEESNDPSMW